MGIELPSDQDYVRSEIAELRKKFRNKCFFFQMGIINEIVSFENSTNKSEEFRQDLKDIRLGLQDILHSNYGIKTAFRENMPMASIIYNVTKSDDELFKDMNESCRKRIKKAIS